MSLTRSITTQLLATGLLAAGTLASPALADSTADDRTVQEFKDYVAGKMPNLSDTQLGAIAAAVDGNGDGIVSDAEFAGRMEAIQEVMAGGGATPPGNDPIPAGATESDAAEGDPVDVPDPMPAGDITVLLITNDELATAWV